MKIVADTNTFLAVGLKEPERSWIIEMTNECDLVSPAVLPFEIGNALSSLARRKIVTQKQLPLVWDAIMAIPVELADIDVRAALVLAGYFGIYAYDAYFLQCAIECRSVLLTLDKGMRRVARELDVRLLEPS